MKQTYPFLFFLLAISALLAPVTRAQTHFSACLDGTGNVFNANVIVPVESTPDVDGVPLATGSEIAAFSSDPAYPDLCVGMLTWQGSHSFMVVWGDDDLTSARDGLLADEELLYRVWDSASGVEFTGNLIDVSYAQGDGLYSNDEVYVLADLSVTTLPEVPVLVDPSDGALAVPVDLTLTWNASTGAESYHLQLATDANFDTLVVNQSALADTSHQATGLGQATPYWWRVRASNAGGDSPWSAARSFTTEPAPVTPPEAPTLVSPSDGALAVPVDLTLTWNASTGAENYRLQVATDASFANVVFSQSGLTGTSRQVTGLDHEVQYYWRVRASNAGGAGPWSAVRSFTTEQAPVTLPETPSLLDPANKAKNVPVVLTFSWSTAARAASYHLQVSTSRNFSTRILDEPGLAGTSLEATGLHYTTKYHWRVRASNTAGNSPWSSKRSFTTELAPVTPPEAPTLVSPSDGATGVTVSPTLTWNSVNGADSYRLQVATDASFANVIFSQSGLTGTSHQVTGLDNEVQYHWRVQASNAGGAGPWSAGRNFTTEQAPVTQPTAPMLVNPQDRATGEGIKLTFTWNTSSGADTYHLQVSTSKKFVKPKRVIDEPTIAGTSFDAAGLQYATTYYWRVRAGNVAGDSPWSAAHSFTTEQSEAGRIAAPPLVDPVNGSANVSTSVLLIWARAGGASGYHLQVSAQDDFSRLLVDEGDLAGTSYEVEDLDRETTYYWRLRAGNYQVSSEWSHVQHFTTGSASGLLAPRPLMPLYAATGVAVPTRLVWTISPFATTYRVLIMRAASSGGGDDIVIDTTGIASLHLQVQALETGTEYTWRVKATSTAGESPWSSRYRFTTHGDLPTASESEEEIPEGVHLYQNYPNPFNPETTIAFDLPATMPVTLQVYDLLGQEIAILISQTLPAGRHQAPWDASNLPSGLYLYQLSAGNNRVSRTLALIK